MASSADPSTLGSLRDAADTLADIDQQATTLCASCGGGATLTPPAVLAAGAGAATVTNLIARPVTQASADIAQANRCCSRQPPKIGGLQRRAQGAADKLGEGRRAGQRQRRHGTPLTSTLDQRRPARPEHRRTGAGTTVKDLVGGLTTTVTGGGGSSEHPTRGAG